MPVSRKRKKKPGKPGRPRKPALIDQRIPGAPDHHEFAEAWRGLTAYRDEVRTRRHSLAAAAAEVLVADLVKLLADQPDTIVDDALCVRLGTLLGDWAQAPVDDRPGPDDIAEAMVAAAAAAVEAATEDPGAWRVLAAVAGILPHPDGQAAIDTFTRLRDKAGDKTLPATPGPVVAGPVLWTRDRYGSRFAVTAPITTADEPARWYLWDIDVCGHEAVTVHSGFYPSQEAALTAWQAGVGLIAAEGTVFAPVDDPWLVAELLPVEQGFLRVGGESAEQFAEYHRSKRLGEAVKQAMERPGTRPPGGLDAATAAAEFVTWLRGRQQLPDDAEELAAELADSWCINGIDAVFATCSPHRVALFVDHVRGFYVDEFADRLVALLPEWTRWLADRNATPPELADRCEPHAHGRPYSPSSDEDSGFLARVIE